MSEKEWLQIRFRFFMLHRMLFDHIKIPFSWCVKVVLSLGRPVFRVLFFFMIVDLKRRSALI